MKNLLFARLFAATLRGQRRPVITTTYVILRLDDVMNGTPQWRRSGSQFAWLP